MTSSFVSWFFALLREASWWRNLWLRQLYVTFSRDSSINFIRKVKKVTLHFTRLQRTFSKINRTDTNLLDWRSACFFLSRESSYLGSLVSLDCCRVQNYEVSTDVRYTTCQINRLSSKSTPLPLMSLPFFYCVVESWQLSPSSHKRKYIPSLEKNETRVTP